MKKRGFIVLLLTITVAAALFAQSDPLNFVQTGAATQELNSAGFVAAHAILPIGQEVLVTNLQNGAQVTVSISERISPSSSRIIDLSSEAAARIGIADKTASVTIEAKLNRSALATPVPQKTFVAESAPPPPSDGYTPTSEITPVVPPWETGNTPWPVQQSNNPHPWLPELSMPWISGIEREQRGSRPPDPAQTAPAYTAPPAYTPAPAYTTPPVSAPDLSGPSVKVLPRAPGEQDKAFYRVQLGAFSARANAQKIFDRLLNAGFSPVFETQGRLTKVQIPWVRGDEIQTMGRRLYRIGFREVLIRSER